MNYSSNIPAKLQNLNFYIQRNCQRTGSEKIIFYSNLTFSIQRKCLFINIYNSLTIHAMVFQSCKGQIPDSPIKVSFKYFSVVAENPWQVSGFWKIHAYNIGGLVYTLDQMEHGVLRANKGEILSWGISVGECLLQVIPLLARQSSSWLTREPRCVWLRWIPGSTLLSTVELSPVPLSGYTRRTSNKQIKYYFLSQTLYFLE